MIAHLQLSQSGDLSQLRRQSSKVTSLLITREHVDSSAGVRLL